MIGGKRKKCPMQAAEALEKLSSAFRTKGPGARSSMRPFAAFPAFGTGSCGFRSIMGGPCAIGGQIGEDAPPTAGPVIGKR
jgi:hypothetical protein